MRDSYPMQAGPFDVLVVDDERVVGDSIRLVLGAEGLRVAVAPDAASALCHPALATCRLVLCDLVLPDRPRTDLVRAIRSARPAVPVVAVTGYATAANRVRALEAGVSDFLPKPFDESELLAVVRRTLGEKERRS